MRSPPRGHAHAAAAKPRCRPTQTRRCRVSPASPCFHAQAASLRLMCVIGLSPVAPLTRVGTSVRCVLTPLSPLRLLVSGVCIRVPRPPPIVGPLVGQTRPGWVPGPRGSGMPSCDGTILAGPMTLRGPTLLRGFLGHIFGPFSFGDFWAGPGLAPAYPRPPAPPKGISPTRMAAVSFRHSSCCRASPPFVFGPNLWSRPGLPSSLRTAAYALPVSGCRWAARLVVPDKNRSRVMKNRSQVKKRIIAPK